MRRVSHWLALLGMIALVTCSLHPDLAAQQAPQAGEDSAPPPMEESPLLQEPQGPQALFDAVVLTTNLARLRLARHYLDELMALEPNDEALLEMRDRHGPAAFMRLARVDELQPASVELLERVNAAFRRRATDPRRIDALISQLTGEPRERELAILQLQTAGAVAVPQLLVRMQDPTLLAQRDLLTYTLTRLGREIVPALIGALDTPNPDLRSIVIESLGWIRDPAAIPHLWYYALDEDQPAGIRLVARTALTRLIHGTADDVQVQQLSTFGVVDELKQQAMAALKLTPRPETDESGQVTLWSWDAERGTVGSRQVTPARATLYSGVRTSWQALALAPEREDLQALHVALSLAYAATTGESYAPGSGSAAFDLALTSGPDVLTSALKLALEARNRDAAVAVLRGLAQVGTANGLYGAEAKNSPILAALNAPDPAVQFQAASTILLLDPQQPFPNSRRVVEILARALLDGAVPRGLVIDPSAEHAATTAGLLRELGFEPEIAPTGRRGFQLAAERGDIMLIMINAAVSHWPLSQTLANLRADARTALIPIAVFGPTASRARAEGLIARYAPATYVVESIAAEHLSVQLEPFLSATPSPDVSAEARQQRKLQAVRWLAYMAEGQRSRIYDLEPAESALSQSIANPELAADAVFALAAIPTASAQERLQQVVINGENDPRLRAHAARLLVDHIREFGMSLRDGEVAAIKSEWEAATETNLRTALAAVIGSLQPDARRVGQRLKSRPSPLLPAPEPPPAP